MTATNENIEAGWLKCPHCGKKIFPIDGDTDIKHLIILCKLCKEKVTIHIKPVAT